MRSFDSHPLLKDALDDDLSSPASASRLKFCFKYSIATFHEFLKESSINTQISLIVNMNSKR